MGDDAWTRAQDETILTLAAEGYEVRYITHAVMPDDSLENDRRVAGRLTQLDKIIGRSWIRGKSARETAKSMGLSVETVQYRLYSIDPTFSDSEGWGLPGRVIPQVGPGREEEWHGPLYT